MQSNLKCHTVLVWICSLRDTQNQWVDVTFNSFTQKYTFFKTLSCAPDERNFLKCLHIDWKWRRHNGQGVWNNEKNFRPQKGPDKKRFLYSCWSTCTLWSALPAFLGTKYFELWWSEKIHNLRLGTCTVLHLLLAPPLQIFRIRQF